jgi:DNA-directed DNA polymerase III PolC
VPNEVNCVPLRMRSHFSLGSGASPVDAIALKAAACGMRAVALTDENNLYGAIAFAAACRARSLRALFGAIVDEPGTAEPLREVVALVRDETGYGNLCEVLSMRHLHRGFSLRDELAPRQEGLTILVRDEQVLGELAPSVDPGRLRAEVVRPTIDIARERSLVEAAGRLGVRCVASVDAFFVEPDEFELHEALSAMRHTCTIGEVRGRVAHRASGWMRTPEEMSRLFCDAPEFLRESERAADECAFDILALRTVFPRLPGDAPARLSHDAFDGARSRYGAVGDAVRSRLERELDLIARLGFADYFLVVADIVRHARSLGTPVAGRGSGASSLVAYCLGITNVDPLRFNLPFERFLNEGRADYPDLDVDFCWRLRDEVIAYVYRTYGDGSGGAADRIDLARLHVAMIATYATLQPALAFRESARVTGIPNGAITEIAARLRGGLSRERWDTLPAEPAAVELALRLARRLEGCPHHLSVHCGGVVITPGSIARHAPLERAEKGVIVTQYDKDGVEEAGLVKIDLLGNRALSSIGEAVRLVGSSGGGIVDPETLPERDVLTERLLAAGDTIGVNQLESPAMRHLARQLRPASVRDLMQLLALIRPGAASLGMKDAFVRRARSIEPVPPIDPRLDEILRQTYGIMLYEDDALFVASRLAGLPLADADKFRRAVTKCRSDDERLRLSELFLGRARETGTDAALAAGLWVQMAKFNSYSFCRAHAASYGRLAWANAYMKAHHPAQFWVAALNNNQGMYEPWVYVEEAKRSGVRVLLPCVNRSALEFSLEDGQVRAGLGRVRELGEHAIRSILDARPFEGLTDFVARTAVRLAEAERLVRAGALDFCGRARPELLLELYAGFESAARLRGRRCAQNATLFRMPDGPRRAAAGAYSAARRWRDEWDLAGFATGYHPVAWLRRRLTRMGVSRSRDIAGSVGARIALCGIAAAARTAQTSRGETMCFVTLSDEDGLFEVTLFPEAYRRHRAALADSGFGPYVVDGRVESQYDALSITAARVQVFGGPHGRPAPAVPDEGPEVTRSPTAPCRSRLCGGSPP